MLQIDPSSETDEDEEHTGTNVNSSMEVANKFIRNGNEIRRSLRRINSLTRCDTNRLSARLAPSLAGTRHYIVE